MPVIGTEPETSWIQGFYTTHLATVTVSVAIDWSDVSKIVLFCTDQLFVQDFNEFSWRENVKFYAHMALDYCD